MATPTTDSAEAGFARDMQFHHGQAVEMAMTVSRASDDPAIRALAYDIATNQSAQQGEMYGWLVQWGLPQSGGPLMAWMEDTAAHAAHVDRPARSPEDLLAQMGMASEAELDQLENTTGVAGDCLFLRLMIRHHDGAVPMAQALLEKGTDPRVRQFAQTVITTQTAEIQAMRSLAAARSCG